jgi:hypothetical protein
MKAKPITRRGKQAKLSGNLQKDGKNPRVRLGSEG